MFWAPYEARREALAASHVLVVVAHPAATHRNLAEITEKQARAFKNLVKLMDFSKALRRKSTFWMLNRSPGY